MLSFIKGELVEVFEDSVVIENNGIGFNIKVPKTVLDNIPSTGEIIMLYTYMAVREDDISLFGFFTREDLDVYKMLINVNGIGPKGALNILSAISTDDLRFAVLSDDVNVLKSVPGIGVKTAQRLIIELKDKLNLAEAFEMAINKKNSPVPADESAQIKNDVCEALVALGYSGKDALMAVKKVKDLESKDSETVLKEALKLLL
ncbi:MAG: Holliday junction branch migration protein RuvA [Lachnospira sp.]